MKSKFFYFFLYLHTMSSSKKLHFRKCIFTAYTRSKEKSRQKMANHITARMERQMRTEHLLWKQLKKILNERSPEIVGKDIYILTTFPKDKAAEASGERMQHLNLYLPSYVCFKSYLDTKRDGHPQHEQWPKPSQKHRKHQLRLVWHKPHSHTLSVLMIHGPILLISKHWANKVKVNEPLAVLTKWEGIHLHEKTEGHIILTTTFARPIYLPN